MNKVIIKIIVIIILCGILALLFHYSKNDRNSLEKDKVTVMEKYFAPSQSSVATGIKSKKEIQVKESEAKKCAMEFSNKKIFEVDCDKYLDYNIGDKIVIIHQNDRLVKIGKK